MARVQYAFTQYDKLSDDLYWLGKLTVLRMNVQLGHKNNEDMKESYHKEFMYDSKYIDVPKSITLRRSFSYYLTIDRLDNREMSVMIRVQDIMLLRAHLANISRWFDNSSGVFTIIRKKLQVTKPQTITIPLACGKFIKFDPIVITYEDSGSQIQGVRLTISDNAVYCDMSIDSFYGFYYLINTIDMFQAAQSMVNYFGRPDFGTNLVEFESSMRLEDAPQIEPQSKFGKNRTVTNKDIKPKSYFDTIDDM